MYAATIDELYSWLETKGLAFEPFRKRIRDLLDIGDIPPDICPAGGVRGSDPWEAMKEVCRQLESSDKEWTDGDGRQGKNRWRQLITSLEADRMASCNPSDASSRYAKGRLKAKFDRKFSFDTEAFI